MSAGPFLECKLLNDKAKPSVRATQLSAGYDLYGIKCKYNDGYGTSGVIDTGVAMQIPMGYCGIIKARSSYASKYGMRIEAGVIDADYRGEVKVLFSSIKPFTFEPGERIAQILIIPVFAGEVAVVEEFSRDKTDRSGGFGSTGNKEI